MQKTLFAAPAVLANSTRSSVVAFEACAILCASSAAARLPNQLSTFRKTLQRGGVMMVWGCAIESLRLPDDWWEEIQSKRLHSSWVALKLTLPTYTETLRTEGKCFTTPATLSEFQESPPIRHIETPVCKFRQPAALPIITTGTRVFNFCHEGFSVGSRCQKLVKWLRRLQQRHSRISEIYFYFVKIVSLKWWGQHACARHITSREPWLLDKVFHAIHVDVKNAMDSRPNQWGQWKLTIASTGAISH